MDQNPYESPKTDAAAEERSPPTGGPTRLTILLIILGVLAVVFVSLLIWAAAKYGRRKSTSASSGADRFVETKIDRLEAYPTANYRFTVTGETVGIGTVQVSHGHDEAADETTFSAVPVTVEASD